MDRRDVENGIMRSWNFIESLGLEETFSSGAPLSASEEWRDISIRGDVSYSELYQTGLRLSHYNFALVDFSYFQFGWDGRGIVRYAYYPNPFVVGESGVDDFKRRRELVSAGMITNEEFQAILRDAPAECRVPLIRYENSPAQWRELRHPCSHFHIGHHGDNRWAAERLLTPLAFTMFIMKQYYSTFWEIHGADEASVGGNRFEQSLIDERSNCFEIDSALFTAMERRSFSIS